MKGQFAPRVRYGNVEWLLMRIAFAAVVGWRFLGQEFFADQPFPNGLAHLFDLSAIAASPFEALARGALALALVSYALGVALPWATAVIFVLILWIGTLANSQGAISHSNQILSLVLLGQLAAHLRFALPRLSWSGLQAPVGIRVQDLAVHYSQQMVVGVYVTAGITKILRSRGRWILDLPDISVEIVKTHAQAFHDHLQPGLIERGEQIANLVLAHPQLARFVLSGGLFLELGAFVALRGRREAFIVGALLIAMHRSIEFTMLLRFTANQLVVLIFLVNLPFLIVRALQFASPRWRPWSSA